MREPFLSPSWHRVKDLKPRLRDHGRVHRHRYRGESWYVVEDTATGRVHRFTPAVYLFIGLMDGRRTVDDLWLDVAGRLEQEAPTQGEIVRLLAQLHGADLLQSDVPADVAELFERHSRQERGKFKQRFSNPMAIRVPLFDPTRFIDATLPYIRFLFGWFGAVLWLAVVVPAAVLALMNWTPLTENITDNIFATENLLAIALVYPVVKAFHEFGHGYAAKVSGGAVHEMGLLFLVLFPVPYVDATSSAAFRSKWRRAGVGAAGIIVELFLASLALYVWLLAEPGAVRTVAYNVMLIGGVSTLFFNGNPFLRFDGYYVMADLIEIPNLGQRANKWWGWLAQRYAFGAKDVDPPAASRGERLWFLFYAPVSYVYRLIVLFGIVMIVANQFFVIGVVLAIWAVFNGVFLPLGKSLGHVVRSPALARNRGRAVGLTVGVAAAAAAIVTLAPMPLHTTAEGVVWMPENAIVRAGAEGFVQRLVARPGDIVQPGDPLVESEEPTLDAQIRVLRARVAAFEARLAAEQVTDRVQAEVTRRELASEQASLAREEERAGRLVVRAGAEGAFVVPEAADLPGRYYKRGEIIGYIATPPARIVRVVVPQSDIELVRDRLHGAAIRVHDRLDEVHVASMGRGVPAASDQLPSRALAADGGGPFAVDPRDQNGLKTPARHFQFDLEVPAELGLAAYGGRVHVRFDHGWEPLGQQWYRRARQLFLARFDA